MDLTGACVSDYVGCVRAFVTLCPLACVCVYAHIHMDIKNMCVCVRMVYVCACLCMLPFDEFFYFYSAVALRMSNTLCKSGKQ